MIRRAATSAALAAPAVLAVTAFAPAAPDLHPVLANARTCRAAGACAGSRATPQRYANCTVNQLSLSVFSAAQP